MFISVVIVTFNEEENIERTLCAAVALIEAAGGEIIVVDSESTDRTCEIARAREARVLVEKWRGFAAQKNYALDQAKGDWILSLDADEEVSAELRQEILGVLESNPKENGYFIPRRNYFLGRWIRHGGFYPDPKLRLFRRGAARFEDRAVHEDAYLTGNSIPGRLHGDILHHSYPRLKGYLGHMNRYSSLGAEMAVEKGRGSNSLIAFWMNVVARPAVTFVYNYLFRLGFLDGREGLLLHLYHATYVSWKYAKAWEGAHGRKGTDSGSDSAS